MLVAVLESVNDVGMPRPSAGTAILHAEMHDACSSLTRAHAYRLTFIRPGSTPSHKFIRRGVLYAPCLRGGYARLLRLR